jgi:hypothetical protein
VVTFLLLQWLLSYQQLSNKQKLQNMSKTHFAICGLYYKHVTILNYYSSIINKFRGSHTDGTRVIIYDHHMFMGQATSGTKCQLIYTN